jgi:siroheme synthase (precorrin-2 oxidase/ferrochelatase)
MSAALLPIFVKLEGSSCLVVGGGAVALQKVRSLLECGARVTVIAPDAKDEIQDLAERGSVVWHRRGYVAEDIAGHRLLIAATNDPEVNHAVYRDGVAGPLQIGISTAGESPGLAQRLRQQLESLIDEGTGPWLERLGALRREVVATHPAGEERNRLLRTLASREVCDAAHCPARVMALGAPGGEHREATERGSWWLT